MLADDALGRQREDPAMPLDNRYLAAFDAIDADPNQLLVVAQRAGTPVGCLQISFLPGLSRLGTWRGQIESVRIAADERGEGCGRQMFEWAIQQCRQRGCGLVQLTTDKSRGDVRQFYEALGFTSSHEGMKLQLDSEDGK